MTRPPPCAVVRRSAVLRIAAALATAVLAVGCSSSGFTAKTSTTPSGGTPSHPLHTTTAPPPPPPPPAPATAECRKLDYSAISRYSNADKPVDCGTPHTAFTFAVETIPSKVNVAGASIGNKSIQGAASKICNTAYSAYIGGDPATRALARLSVTYFLPNQLGFNRGANWVRCDVVALKTFNTLAPLPVKLKGLLNDPKALHDYGVCSTGDPGAAGSLLVMCTQKHAFRALTALRLGADNAPYPGKAKAGPGGQQRCSTYIADKLGKGGGYTIGWTYPTSPDWVTGQRFGYCWLKSAA